jgi:hypothetical protein
MLNYSNFKIHKLETLQYSAVFWCSLVKFRSRYDLAISESRIKDGVGPDFLVLLIAIVYSTQPLTEMSTRNLPGG